MLYRRQLIQREKDQPVSEPVIEEKKEEVNQDEQMDDDLINNSVDNSVEEVPTITFGDYEWSNPLSVVGFNGYYDSYGKYHYLELYYIEHSICYYNEDKKQIDSDASNIDTDNISAILQDQDNSLLGSLLFTTEDEYGYTVIKHVNEIDDFPNRILGFQNEYPYFYIKKAGTASNQYDLCIFPRGIFDLFYKLYYPQLEFQTTMEEEQFQNNDTNGYPLVTDKMVYSIFAYFFQTLNELNILWKASVDKEPFLIYNNGELFVHFVFDMVVDAKQKLFDIIKTVANDNTDYSNLSYEQMIIKLYKDGDFESYFRIQEVWYKKEDGEHIVVNNKFNLQRVTVANPMLHADNNNLSYPDENYNNSNESTYFYKSYIQPHYHFIRTFDGEFTSYFVSEGDLNDYQQLGPNIEGVIPCTYCELYNVKLTISNTEDIKSKYPYHTLSDFYIKYNWQEYNEDYLDNNTYADDNTIWCMYDLRYKTNSTIYTIQMPVLRLNCEYLDVQSTLNTYISQFTGTDKGWLESCLKNIINELDILTERLKSGIESILSTLKINLTENKSVTVQAVDCYLLKECKDLMYLYSLIHGFCDRIAVECQKNRDKRINITVNDKYYGGFIDTDGNSLVPEALSDDKYPYKYYSYVEGAQNSSKRQRLWQYFANNDAFYKFATNSTTDSTTENFTRMSEITEKYASYWEYLNIRTRKFIMDNGWELELAQADLDRKQRCEFSNGTATFEEDYGFGSYSKTSSESITMKYGRLINDVYMLMKNYDSNILKLLATWYNTFKVSDYDDTM